MLKPTVTWIEPVAAVSFVSPSLGVRCIVPAMGISVLQPSTVARLDVRGLHWRTVDAFSFVDAQGLLLEKEAGEPPFLLKDKHTYEAELGKRDPVEISDVFDRVCSFVREFNELTIFSDLATLSLRKWFADSFQFKDSITLAPNKGIVESLSFDELPLVINSQQQRTDALSISDSFYLNANSYSELSYFAEDYVGATRTV